MRNKIYAVTGIPPYRQHIITKDNDNRYELTYKIISSNTLVSINLYRALQDNTGGNNILNIPIDIELVSKKEDLEGNNVGCTKNYVKGKW